MAREDGSGTWRRGCGVGALEFEATSGVYTELQCGSYIFMDACEMAWNRFATNTGLVRSLCAFAPAWSAP